LITINNEAKVRRSTKSVILGKAKVMSYEDLREAREKRDAKDKAKATAGKGKRGRKPKSAAPGAEDVTADKTVVGSAKVLQTEPDAPESAKAKVARVSEASEPVMASVAQMIAPVAQMMEAPEPAKAPLARMREA
jgi:hypothetical protein